mmetsp:Transcript_4002/g.6696  ORF Transcript_4002/g.6696 Transcript_4002/m.6696 type:complete len:103 (-) Transcript_4002:188-496(-)
MCSDLGEGSRCCAFYSAVGVLFTLWVGLLISQQSFYIAGIEDADEAKNSAFGAMGMFIFTFVASMAGIWYDSNYKQEPIAENEATEGYQLSTGDTPTYGTSS